MMKRQRYMGGRYKRRGLRKQCNEEGYTEERMRVVKEKGERENKGARAQKESENTDYCAKRIWYHVCVFRRGFVRGATRPPGSQKERDGGRKERERKRRERGRQWSIREQLPNGPRLLQRKKIDMHESRTRERAEEGWRGASGALLLGEQKDKERERGRKKVVYIGGRE